MEIGVGYFTRLHVTTGCQTVMEFTKHLAVLANTAVQKSQRDHP